MRTFARVAFVAGAVVFSPTVASAESFFIRPAGAGAHSGASWTDAWSIADLSSHWGSGAGAVGAGDTIYFAGGDYHGPIGIGASGTADAPLVITRATATSRTSTNAPGWDPAFDSTVSIACDGAAPQGFVVGSMTTGSHVVIDGVTPAGFSFVVDHRGSRDQTRTGALVLYDTAVQSFTFRNARIFGVPQPSWDGSGGEPRQEALGMQLGASAPNQNRDIHIEYVELAQLSNPIHFGRNDGIVIEHCSFHDNSGFGGNEHPNTVYMHIEGALGPHDVTFRYNDVARNWNTGFYIACDGSCDGLAISGFYFYGNVFHDIDDESATCIALDNIHASLDDVQVHNNTFIHCATPIRQALRPGTLAPTGGMSNNIFFMSGLPSALPNDYNWFSGTDIGREAHGVAGGAVDPFVSWETGDYHLEGTIDAQHPRDRGASLDARFGRDPEGRMRGADGHWDIGAYEAGPCCAEVDAGSPAVDAGITDAGSPREDASAASDAGTITNDSGYLRDASGGNPSAATGGCSCRVTRNESAANGALPFAALALWLASKRRRRSRNGERSNGE